MNERSRSHIHVDIYVDVYVYVYVHGRSQDVNVSNNLILSTLQKEIRPHFYRQFPLMAAN